MGFRVAVRGALVMLLVALAACETAPHAPAPVPAGAVPDLRGTWTGTWGGAPVTLVVTEQHEVGDTGVHVGSWQIFGRSGPGLSGVLSVSMRGQRVSVPVVGRLGSDAGRLAVLLQGSGPAGDHHLRLVQMGPDRLHGTGESTSPWAPRGAAQLVRQAAPSGRGSGGAVGSRNGSSTPVGASGALSCAAWGAWEGPQRAARPARRLSPGQDT